MHSHSLPEAFFASLAEADEDTLVQRRHAVNQTLNFIVGSTTTPAWAEGKAYIEEIDREINFRRASGRKGYRSSKQAA
jgi:hypothetical protein